MTPVSPKRRTVVSYALVVVLVAIAAWFVLSGPVSPQPVSAPPAATAATTAPSRTGQATAGRTTAAGQTEPTSRRDGTCLAGEPARLVIPSLGVDAPFEQIGLDQAAPPDHEGRQPLGNPKDRTKAGWYAEGPRPGEGRGTVLTNGHTYRNNSAIFKEDFSSRIDTGQLIHVEQDNGSTCSYRVQRVWREVGAAEDYPRIVESEHLYNFNGPERLFLATCGGSWNSTAQDYEQISMLIATPVGRD